MLLVAEQPQYSPHDALHQLFITLALKSCLEHFGSRKLIGLSIFVRGLTFKMAAVKE